MNSDKPMVDEAPASVESQATEGGLAQDVGEVQAAPEEATAEVEELKQQLAESEAKAAANWDSVLRARAELENAQRRMQRDVDNAHKFALEKFAVELLPVKDSLELGLAAAVDSDAEKLREGMELTLKMLTTAMEKFGIRELDPQGEAFNPELHQAMAAQESSQAEPDTVLSVMQKGYQLNDRLIRPALVIVAKPPSEQTPRVDEKA